MSILDKFACRQGVRSDVPNQELARYLASNHRAEDIEEIAKNLWNKDKAIQSDCIKILYEIGYIKPELIAKYVNDYIKLLKDRNNRLVWGGMIALSTIARIKHKEIFANLDIIKETTKKGSVITADGGIMTLANTAASGDKYNQAIFPYLIDCLKNCRPKSVGQYSESISVAVTKKNLGLFADTINARKHVLSPSQLKRVDKVLKKLNR